MAKANHPSNRRFGKSKTLKLKVPDKSYSNKKSTPSKTMLQAFSNPDEIRLNKYIANSGMCSRREADMHISIGSVMVNGKVVTEMGYKVNLDDEVRFDGARINPGRKSHLISSHHECAGRGRGCALIPGHRSQNGTKTFPETYQCSWIRSSPAFY